MCLYDRWAGFKKKNLWKSALTLNFDPNLSTNQIAAFFKFKYLENRLTDFQNFWYGNIKQWEEQNEYMVDVISG